MWGVKKISSISILIFDSRKLWTSSIALVNFQVYAPTGPVNRDYDDVRRYYDAACNGMKKYDVLYIFDSFIQIQVVRNS